MTSPWTAELKDEVRGLWKEQTATEIEAVLHGRGVDISRNAILGMVHRSGLSVSDKTKVHYMTTDETAQRSRTSKHDQIGPPTGSLAYKTLHAIKRKQREAAEGIKPEPFAVQEAVDVIPLNIPFSELERGDCKCRWPLDPPADAPGAFVYCGNPTPKDHSYCPGHARIAYTPPPARKRVGFVDLGKSSGGIFGRAA